jgi:hypothetical protein
MAVLAMVSNNLTDRPNHLVEGRQLKQRVSCKSVAIQRGQELLSSEAEKRIRFVEGRYQATGM